MPTTIEIVDHGRGPQLSTSRLTVLDVFYYLHRGHDFESIRRALPRLSRPEFDAVLAYVRAHHDELVERDRRAEELIRGDIQEQKVRGLYQEIDEAAPPAERVARLREILHRQQAERNGGPAPR
jgi:hypothetical protein